jgi:hypothetical protein
LQTLLIPFKEFLYAFVNLHFVSPSQGVEFRYVNEFTHGSVRLADIKRNLTLKAYCFDNEFREFTDGKFLACAHIDVAVANLTQAGDVTTTACAVVAVNCTVGAGAIVY